MDTSKSFKRRVFRLTLVAALGGLLFGYDTAVVSGTVSSLNHYFVSELNVTHQMKDFILGFLVSSALIGCIMGSMISGVVNNRIGRRKTMMISALLFLLSAVGSAMPEMVISHTGDHGALVLSAFVFYRIAGGVGVGLASMTSPVYIAEIVPADIRGRLVALNQFAIVFGMLISYLANFMIARMGDATWLDALGWRYMFSVEAIPAVLFFVMLLFVPESPYWHLLKGKTEEARKTLYSLMPKPKAETFLKEVHGTLNNKSAKLLSYGWMIIFVGLLINVFQQFTGINIVLYYAPMIFSHLGASAPSQLYQTVFIGVVNMVFTVVSMYTVDRLGRKALLMIGSGVMAVALIALGFSFSLHLGRLLPFEMLLLFIAAFAVSWGPIAWVLNSELFPTKIRNVALAVAISVQWIFNYLVSSTFPIMDKSHYLTAHYHHGFSFWVYGVLTLLSLVFVFFFLPETRKKSLEEIESLWIKEKAED